MSGRLFIDTNVLLYAYDLDAMDKRDIALKIIEKLWEDGNGVISTQVLQEFYVNVTRKIPYPLSRSEARGILECYLSWHVELNGPEATFLASEIEERYSLSFWDALIVAAARNAGAEKILTEDLNHGQKIEGILIENPFFGS